MTSSKNENKHECSSCTLYIVLFSIFFTINVGIGTYFVYSRWYLRKYVFRVNNLMNLYMEKVKQIETKNRIYHFYNDIINLKNFESNLLKIDKKHCKAIDINYSGYITIKKKNGDGENIYSVNPFYLLVNYVSGYVEEKSGNEYFIFDHSIIENKGLLKKYADVS